MQCRLTKGSVVVKYFQAMPVKTELLDSGQYNLFLAKKHHVIKMWKIFL